MHTNVTVRTLEAVPPYRNSLHTPTEADIRKIGELDPSALSDEDLRFLKRINDCRASLQECENEMEELKETRKARKQSLDEAITNACRWAENRSLAKQLTLGLGG